MKYISQELRGKNFNFINFPDFLVYDNSSQYVSIRIKILENLAFIIASNHVHFEMFEKLKPFQEAGPPSALGIKRRVGETTSKKSSKFVPELFCGS